MKERRDGIYEFHKIIIIVDHMVERAIHAMSFKP